MSIFDKAVDRRSSNADKWNKAAINDICGNPNAEAFWVADMDLATSPLIKEALQRETDLAVPGYASHKNMLPYFISFVNHKHGWQLDGANVTYAQGMLHAISLALNMFTNPGDEVLLPYPVYQPFVHLIQNSERVVKRFDLTNECGTFTFDREKYSLISKDCKAIMFCSPLNPSGLVFKKEDLEFILKLAKERGQLVLSDEIHSDLVHPSAKHYPMGYVNKDINATCITFMAPSKTFNVAGEHCAFAIFSDKEMLERYKAVQKRLFLGSEGYFAGTLAEAVYSPENYQFLDDLDKYLEDNAELMRNFFKAECPEVKMGNACASFIVFLDFSEVWPKILENSKKHPEIYDNDHYILSHFLGHYANLCLNDGSWFGSGYEAFARFNYGTSREEVISALNAIKKAINALN